MASSVQERLQLSRTPLDKWTTREQLCLASAVSCSSDQNWSPSVSRTLKLVCANGAVARPADWFSQKNCALQYSHLLENVETLKRKKRTSESGVDSPSVVETPTDLILRRLTEERVNELKVEIRKEQEEYTKIYNELKAMQSGQLAEEQLLEMWHDIEKQQERQRIEEMKLENQMREREQQRQEIQRNWRTLGPAVATPKPAADTTAVDMDVEEIIGAPKPTLSNVQQQQSQQQQSQQQQSQQQQPPTPTGTSPLLSSLLKSPTASGGTTGTPTGANSARTTAPTITTLLTSGSIPNANQPALIVRSTVSPNEAAQLLTRPISGPPMESTSVAGAIAQNLLSPSQAAPTLSMLLEKTKVTGSNTTVVSGEEKVGELSDKNEAPTVQDSNNEEVPMELEEDVTTHASNANVDLTAIDFDESDANEEQQLLEVFKNIGNIDELDIDVAAVIDDEEVDFLKGVDEDSPHETADDMELESKVHAATLEAAEVEAALARVDTKNDRKTEEESKDLKEMNIVKTEANLEVAEGGLAGSEINKEPVKVETISSDDSNDNIPLAAVASLEQKAAQEKEFLKEKVESAIKNDIVEDSVKCEATVTTSTAAADDAKEEIRPTCVLESETEIQNAKEAKNGDTAEKSPAESEGSDVIVIPTDDDESNGDKQSPPWQKPKEISDVEGCKRELQESADKMDQTASDNDPATTKMPQSVEHAIDSAAAESMEATTCSAADALAPPPPTISIGDTDEEDSSATDASSVTRKDDKPSAPSGKHFAPQSRKSLHDHSRAEPKTDDESNALTTPAFTPARPPMLRKLRDRDRSESPMIDSEPSITNNTTTSDHACNQRLRRRYSSTPVADSVPNSPASSDRDRDEVEMKVSKKSLLSIYHALQHSKNAVTLQRAIHEDNTPKYEEVCLRPMDLQAVKRSIESGSIRSVNELQRDIMLMCQNGLMLFKEHSVHYKAALAFMQECQSIREFTANSHTNENANRAEQKDAKEGGKTSSSNGSSAAKVRSGSRKSQRIS